MNVSLTPELQKYVKQKLAAGGYQSASEVIRESLRLLVEHDRRQGGMDDVRAKIASGLAQARRGELLDGEAVFARQRARLVRNVGAVPPRSAKPPRKQLRAAG
jgi:antitoxin ParD1/3/4